jgi:hypothetical protein
MAVIEAIQTTYLEADAASVTFSSIPDSYAHLQLRCNMKSERYNSFVDGLRVQFNSDTGAAGYGYHWMAGRDSTPAAWGLEDTYLNLQGMLAARTSGGVTEAANFGTAIIDILDYADDGGKNTTVMALLGTSLDWLDVNLQSGYWDNKDAVHTITLDQVNGPTFVRGSEFTLYGIASS